MRCARLVALWLHCVATGCASLQHGIRRCTMPHRREAHSRGTPWGHAKGYAKGYASPNGRGTSLAVVGRADHVGLVRRTRRLGLRTASPRAPSASRRRAGGTSACRRALHGLHGLAERTRAEGDARAQPGGRVRMGWGGEGGRRPTGSQRSARLAVSAAGASAACSMRCMCASPNMLRLHSTAAGSQRERRREAQRVAAGPKGVVMVVWVGWGGRVRRLGPGAPQPRIPHARAAQAIAMEERMLCARASLHRARGWVRPDVHQVHQNLLAQVEP